MLGQSCLYNQTEALTNAGELHHVRCDVGSFLLLIIEAPTSGFFCPFQILSAQKGITVEQLRDVPATRSLCNLKPNQS